MHSIRFALGTSLTLLACGSSTANPTIVIDADAGPVDAGPPCASSSATPEQACGSLTWTKSEVKSRPRNHHFTGVDTSGAGPFIYAVGGVANNSTIAFVDRAPLNDDGSLGSWETMTPIPTATGGMTGAIVNHVIVIAGGNASPVTDKSYASIIQSDGTLGPWKPSGSVLHPRMHPGAVQKGNTMYVLGGFNHPDVWDDIVKATISAEGSVSAWTSAGTMPTKRSHFSTAQIDDYVFIAGGLTASAFGSPPPITDVTRGRILGDGTIGEWTSMPSLPVSLATHASFVYGGYVYVGSGINDAIGSGERRVWRAPVDASRMLGAWEAVESLPLARAHIHQLPIWNSHVYAVSGATSTSLKSTDEIDIGVFQ